MKGKFVFLKQDKLIEVDNLNSAPEDYDNLIEFIPEFIEGPHTEEEHKEIEMLSETLLRYLK